MLLRLYLRCDLLLSFDGRMVDHYWYTRTYAGNIKAYLREGYEPSQDGLLWYHRQSNTPVYIHPTFID